VRATVQGRSLTRTAGIDRRNQAIAKLQGWAKRNGRPLQIQYTLPTSADGLEASGLAVLQNAVADGVRIDVVNPMVFDYYDHVTTEMKASYLCGPAQLAELGEKAAAEGDSVLVLAIASGRAKPDTQRMPLTGPILLPTIVPLALALSEPPKVGKHYRLPVFNPASMAPADMGFDVQAESAFVVNDSATYDSATAQWRGAKPSTLRAWQVTGKPAAAFSGWVDEQGRIVQTTQLGFELRRLPYELAFENWRAKSGKDAVTNDRDILEMTAIAANKRMTSHTRVLRVRLTGVDRTLPHPRLGVADERDRVQSRQRSRDLACERVRDARGDQRRARVGQRRSRGWDVPQSHVDRDARQSFDKTGDFWHERVVRTHEEQLTCTCPRTFFRGGVLQTCSR